jgi:hypothetical protein
LVKKQAFLGLCKICKAVRLGDAVIGLYLFFNIFYLKKHAQQVGWLIATP